MFSRVLVQKDARLLRDLRIMAYFRQCFPSDLNITTIKELAHALASHSPYEVPVSSIKIKHLHCQVGSRCWLNCCSAILVILHFDASCVTTILIVIFLSSSVKNCLGYIKTEFREIVCFIRSFQKHCFLTFLWSMNVFIYLLNYFSFLKIFQISDARFQVLRYFSVWMQPLLAWRLALKTLKIYPCVLVLVGHFYFVVSPCWIGYYLLSLICIAG